MEKEKNGQTKKLWYISDHIILLVSLLFWFVLALIGLLIGLMRKDDSFPWIMLFVVILLYMGLLFYRFRTISKFRESERLMERFLEGYGIPDSEIYSRYALTPSYLKQIEFTEKIMRSPQLMDLNKRQAQYLALQNQINPHFLYNTLESIRGEALIAGMDSVADMTEALARFFRYTITKVENLVSVEEEVENCRTYFQIQKYRFGDRLQLDIRCSEAERDEIMSCRMPKLTLQPILENSIIHGTELKIGTGTIQIAFERTPQRLLVRISDDGVGMDEETLKNLNRCLDSDGESSDSDREKKGGIALRNVNNRIHLLFGEEYGLHIFSILGKGTDVEISLPITTADAQNSDGVKL